MHPSPPAMATHFCINIIMEQNGASQALVKSHGTFLSNLLTVVSAASLSKPTPVASAREVARARLALAAKIQSRLKAMTPVSPSTASALAAPPIIPMNRRIRRTGMRLKAEAEALQREVNAKVHGDYKSYGSGDGAWRLYFNQRLPHGVPPRRSQRIRSGASQAR